MLARDAVLLSRTPWSHTRAASGTPAYLPLVGGGMHVVTRNYTGRWGSETKPAHPLIELLLFEIYQHRYIII